MYPSYSRQICDQHPVELNKLARLAIEYAQKYFQQAQLVPHVHFELEGCVKSPGMLKIDFDRINGAFAKRGIEGKLIPEYWQNQWEFVSEFAGQSPLKEADNLTHVINWLPTLFKEQGIEVTLIKPVVWSGDSAQLARGSKSIFKSLDRQIHIPNAIQVNVSVSDLNGDNLIATGDLGEAIQLCLIKRSLACSLLFLPESEAFERLKLKSAYGLSEELCSPCDISGGHQGSVALYRQRGKHNQMLGQEPLIVNHLHEALVVTENWQKTARIEHRLGASSKLYNAYLNVLFVLLATIDALTMDNEDVKQHLARATVTTLPESIEDLDGAVGALTLFKQDNWFSEAINSLQCRIDGVALEPGSGLGDKIKAAFVAQYGGTRAIIHTNN
ncbi:hypothetical protein [Thalassotalea ganghwensis]